MAAQGRCCERREDKSQGPASPTSFTVSAVDPSGLPLQLEARMFRPALRLIRRQESSNGLRRHLKRGSTGLRSRRLTRLASRQRRRLNSRSTRGGPHGHTRLVVQSGCDCYAPWQMAGDTGSQLSDPSGGSVDLGGTSVAVNGQCPAALQLGGAGGFPLSRPWERNSILGGGYVPFWLEPNRCW